jgi:hypothetical protein
LAEFHQRLVDEIQPRREKGQPAAVVEVTVVTATAAIL